MRLRHADGTLVHLAYNAGVHPAEDLENLIAHLTRYAVPVRKRLGVERMGIGLWLSPAVADHLIADRIELVRLRRSLDERGLEVVSLNGTGGRNQEAPGPDWAKPERYRYTMALARILAFLLPDDIQSGSISTIPIGWRRDWPTDLQDIATRRLERLARELRGPHSITRKTVRGGFEPGPGRGPGGRRGAGACRRPRSRRSSGSATSPPTTCASASTPATSPTTPRRPTRRCATWPSPVPRWSSSATSTTTPAGRPTPAACCTTP